jgi:hypothetical protein
MVNQLARTPVDQLTIKQVNQPTENEMDFSRSRQICFRWLSKNFDIQGVVIFQVRDNTYGMSSA